MTDLARYREDPIEFITTVLISPDTGQPYVLFDAQREFVNHCYKLDANGRLLYSDWIFGGIKKSAKTELAAILALTTILLFGGRNAEGLIVANALEQASNRVFARIVAIIKASPLLAPEARITNNRIVFPNFHEATITAIATNAANAAGANPTIVCADELHGWTTDNSRRLYDELVPSPARQISARLVTSYAGYSGESELLEEIYKRGMALPAIGDELHAGNGMLFAWHTKSIAPWQTEAWLEQMRRDNRPSTYARMYENKFVSDKSSFVDMDKWDACVSSELVPTYARQSVWLGIDASTKRDSTALVAVTVNKNTNPHTVRLVQHKVFKPPIDFEAVTAQVLDRHRVFIIRKVYTDPMQMVAVAQRLTKAGIPVEQFVQSPSNIAAATSNLLDLINAKTLTLYRDQEMRTAVSRAVIAETSRGWRLDKAKQTDSIDLITALAMACLAAVKSEGEGISCTDPIWSAAWGNSPDDPDGTGAWHMARFMDHIRKFG